MEKTHIYTGYAANNKLQEATIDGEQAFDSLMNRLSAISKKIELPEHDNERQDTFKNVKRRHMTAAIIGEVKNGKRSNENIVNRSVLTLDLDDINSNIKDRQSLSERLSELFGAHMYIFPSLGCNYRNKGLRYHVWLPLSKPVTQRNYEMLMTYYNQLLKKTGIINTIDRSNRVWSQLAGLPQATQYTPEADRKQLVLTVGNKVLDTDFAVTQAQQQIAKTTRPKYQASKPIAKDYLKDKDGLTVVKSFAQRNQDWLASYNNFVAAYFAIKGAEQAGQLTHSEAIECVKALAGSDTELATDNAKKYEHDHHSYKNGDDLTWFVQTIQPETHQASWLRTKPNGTVYTKGDYLGEAIMKKYHIIYNKDVLGTGGAIWEHGQWNFLNIENILGGIADQMLHDVDLWSDKTTTSAVNYIKRRNKGATWKANLFDRSNPYLVEFNNGTLDLRDLSFKENDPKNLIPVHYNYDWNPAMTDPERFCQHWRDYINELVGGDKRAVNTIVRAIGYMYERSYQHSIFMIFLGPGKNGKSIFTNRIKNLIIGAEHVSAVSLSKLASKTDRFSSALLYRKPLNLFNDIDSSFLQNTGTVKNLTGDDQVTAEFKGRTGFSFLNYAFLLFSANELPSFKDDSYGFERRPRIINFPLDFDATLKEKFNELYPKEVLKQEAQAFRQYCILEYHKHMNDDDDLCFKESQQMEQARLDWLNLANASNSFFDDMVLYSETTKQQNTGESPQLLYQVSQDWCLANGVKAVSRANFDKKVKIKFKDTENMRVRSDNGTRLRKWCGLKLTDDAFDFINSDNLRYLNFNDRNKLYGYYAWVQKHN